MEIIRPNLACVSHMTTPGILGIFQNVPRRRNRHSVLDSGVQLMDYAGYPPKVFGRQRANVCIAIRETGLVRKGELGDLVANGASFTVATPL